VAYSCACTTSRAKRRSLYASSPLYLSPASTQYAQAAGGQEPLEGHKSAVVNTHVIVHKGKYWLTVEHRPMFRALARPVLQLQENQVRLLGQRDLAKFNIDVEHRSTSADVEPDVQPEPCSTSLS
jgi:hypothetical protein